jgi:hypothetical protein
MSAEIPLPFWAQQVRAKALALNDHLPLVNMASRDQISELIEKANGLTLDPGHLFTWSRLADWWYGSRVEQAWSLLHEAEFLIIDNSLQALFPTLVEEAVQHAAVLDEADPARVRLTNWVSSQTASMATFA